MKRFEKAGSLLLAVLIVMGLFAGCSGNKPAAGSQSETTQSTDNSGGKMFSKTITLKWMLQEQSTQKISLDSPVIQAIYDKLNVKLELQPVPASDFVAKKASTLASNTMPELMSNMSVEDMRKYSDTGMLLCINDYEAAAPDYFKLVNAGDRINETKKFESDGKMYGFQTLEYNRIGIAPINAIRIDLLKEQNIATPTTWAEFYDAFVKIKAKHPEMTGFSSRRGTNYMLGQYAYSMGTGGFPGFDTERGMYYEPNSDSYVYGPTDAKFTRVVAFMAQAYKDGILDPDYATMNKDKMFEKLSNGTMISVCDNNSFIGRVYNPALAKVSPGASFDIVAPLADEDGKVRSLRYNKDWFSTDFTLISSKVSEPENVIKFLNWLYTEEGVKITNFGREGIEYDMVDGIPTIKADIVEQNKNATDPFSAIQSQIGSGYQCFAKYIDESTYKQVSDPIFIEQGKKIDSYTKEGKMSYLPAWPSFTAEQMSRVTALEQKLSNVFNQEIDKYITGKLSMNDWAKLVEKLKSQGSEELEVLYNAAHKK